MYSFSLRLFCFSDLFLSLHLFMSVSFLKLFTIIHIKLWRFYQMAVFFEAYAFNGDLSKWQTSAVTNMGHMFRDAKAFNHKATLDIAWEANDANNPSVYPGSQMFVGTCSSDPNCGLCGSKNTDGDPVTCSEAQPAKKPSSTVCIFCRNNAYECCTPKLPNGNGATDGTRIGFLGGIVDDWIDTDKRPGIELIYGPIQDWDVSLVTNFRYLFTNLLHSLFNADISKWNVAAAENMYGSKY
jgi:surface protein